MAKRVKCERPQQPQKPGKNPALFVLSMVLKMPGTPGVRPQWQTVVNAKNRKICGITGYRAACPVPMGINFTVSQRKRVSVCARKG
jgi:hypothetical protein